MNIYLIASTSYKQIDNEVQKIIGNSLNVIKYDLRINTLKDAINEAGYYSLTDDKKYIIIKSNNLFKSKKDDNENKEDDTKILENYLNNPNEKCIIIFTSMEIPDKRKKLYKKINEVGKVIIFPTLNKKELIYKCIDLLKENNYGCNYEVASYIVDNSYVNYDIMLNELNKIYTLVPKKTLTIESIKDVISISLNGNVYDYIKAIINRDLKKASLASKDFEVLKIEPSMVLIMLAKEFQIMHLIKRGISSKEIKNLFKKEDWQMDVYMQNSNLYTLQEIKKIIVKLNDYDYQLKSGLIDKSVILDLIALDLCA